MYLITILTSREILSNLEIGIRRFIPKLPLPTVYTDATTQVVMIEKFLASVFSCEVSNFCIGLNLSFIGYYKCIHKVICITVSYLNFFYFLFYSQKTNVSLKHYVLARWEDYTSSTVTPSGPIYQDYLMYRHVFAKENKATPWQPGYFLLK